MSTSHHNGHSQRQTSESIRARMSDVRVEIEEDVSEIRESAKSLTDWRKYVSAHPLMISAGALALGYLVVPRKVHYLKPDAEELVRAFKEVKLVLGDSARKSPRNSLLGSLMGMAVTTAARAAVTSLLANTISHSAAADHSKPHHFQYEDDNAQ